MPKQLSVRLYFEATEDAAHQLQPEDPRWDGEDGERRVRQQRREQEQGEWHCRLPIRYITVCGHSMADRKWKETKQQTSMLPGTTVPGCSLVSFHFLWAILCPQAVLLLRRHVHEYLQI